MNELSILDSLFNDIFDTNKTIAYSCATPKVDVKEEDDSYLLEMELPGHSENDVNIELDHKTLTIASKEEDKKADKKDKEPVQKYILRERRKGNFKRSFTLPDNVNYDGITANFKNGILTIKIEKSPLTAPKKILIESC